MRNELIARYLVPSALVAGIAIACGEREVEAQVPAPAPAPKVVVMNTSAVAWTGMTVLVDGVPACQVAELAAGGTVTVVDGRCETLVPEAAAPAVEPAAAPAVEPAVRPTAGPVAEPAAEPAAKVTVGGALAATVTVSGGVGPARRIGIVNENSFGWSKCTVTLNDQWSYAMPRLAAGEHEGIMGGRFRSPTGDMMTQNHQIHDVAVKCTEGSGSFKPE